MVELEDDIYAILKKRGALNTKLDELRKEKKKLMSAVIENMDETSKKEAKAMDERARRLEEISKEITKLDDEEKELPYTMDALNKELMVLTIIDANKRLRTNISEIDVLDSNINTLEEELRRQVLRKQLLETINKNIYTYMHHLIGYEAELLFRVGYDEEDSEDKEP